MPAHPFKDYDEWKMHIGGGEVRAGGSQAVQVRNPATGEILGEVASASAQDVAAAVDAAAEAFRAWRWVSPESRGDFLLRVADRIQAHRDELVDLETWENGKPRAQSLLDVLNAERTFRFYGGASDKFYGQSVFDGEEEVRKIVYEPYGVVGVIIPWNWPPMHTADFAAIALATGNTVVMKPAPETPLSSLRIAQLAADILPPGVLNVIPGGVEPGVELVRHPGIDFIAFTGSDRTGSKILSVASERIIPSMMELGGKNAALVFADADLEKAINGMVRSAFFNSGQACSGTERILVHEKIYKGFRDRFCEATRKLRVGEGFDESSDVGPIISRRQQERIMAAIERACAAGTRIAAEARLPTQPELADGYWVAPTVLEGAADNSEIMTTEVFGPVPCIAPFSDERAAIELANSVEFGLTAGVWTRDFSRAHRVANALRAGTVAVNCVNTGRLGLPFGGYKRSGIGRKKDFLEAMRTFSQVKAIQMDLRS